MFKQKREKSYSSTPKVNYIIAGRNIYQNDKGQNVLFDSHSKTGYIIQPKDESSFRLYHNRYILVAAILMLGISFNIDWKLILGFSIAMMIILEWRYRKNFLPSLVKVENFKATNKKTMVDALAEQNDKARCAFLAVLYLAFGILMVVNGFQIHAGTFILAGDFIVLAYTIYQAFTMIQAIRKMK